MSSARANPSPGELELLQLLWEQGPLSLSEVHDQLERNVGYTTVQTRLNRLVEKGWVDKEKIGKQPTRYLAVLEPEAVRETQVDHFVEHAVQGSVVPLVAHLVQGANLTPAELAELKQLLKDVERRQQSAAREN
jgi:predicted transcriptional regulator